jgi:hypothetical protein
VGPHLGIKRRRGGVVWPGGDELWQRPKGIDDATVGARRERGDARNGSGEVWGAIGRLI